MFSSCNCPLVYAVVLQLRDDADQVLEAEDVALVLALVDHTVLAVMSAGGVSKVDHSHVHLWAAALWPGHARLAPAAATRAAAAAVAQRGGAVPKAERSRLLFLLHFGFSFLVLVVLLVFGQPLLGVSAGVLPVRSAIVDDEQGAGVKAVGLARLQSVLHLSQSAQHRREQLLPQAPTAVEELEQSLFETGHGQFPALIFVQEDQLVRVRVVHLQNEEKEPVTARTKPP